MVIVVPFRNRREQLKQFASHMEAFLDGHPWRVLVIEQVEGKPFNRGALLNIGFQLSKAECDSLAFHDVDMLPLDAACDYSPLGVGMRHLAGAAEQYGFKSPYLNYIGGVLLSTTSAFESINGFSNEYWGWGSEDDDLFIRASACGVPIERVPGRYRSLPHPRSSRPAANQHRLATTVAHVLGAPGPVSDQQLRWVRRADHTGVAYAPNARDVFKDDGLSSLRYRTASRMSLSTYLGDGDSSYDRHEVVTVEL
jgi:hypothetical protein